MRRPINRKRMGFQAHPHASQIAALDFEAASQAFRRALALSAQARGDAAVDATADEEWRTANALLSIPAGNRRQIAEKVAVFNHAFRSGPLLSDPASQRHVASTGKEADKALLAIYLDLTTEDYAARIAWDAARQDFETAQAAHDAITAREEAEGIELDDESAATFDAASAALERLVNTRAPDPEAMAYKLRWIIHRAHSHYAGDDAENPVTIARLLAGTWDETTPAALYQDAVALSGKPSPVLNVVPDDFDAAAWLEDMETLHGITWTTRAEDPMRVVAQGSGAAKAQAEFDGLTPHRKHEAFHALPDRQPKAQPSATAALRPNSLRPMRSMFLNGLATSYTGQADKVRAIIDAALADVFDPEQWISETEAQTGGRIIPAPGYGLGLADGESGAGCIALSEAFHALTEEQRQLVRFAADLRQGGAQ